MPPPFGRLRYLYLGSADVPRDLAFHVDVLGAEKVWHLEGFGTEVAAVKLGEGPTVLLAGHRPPASAILLYEVPDLDRATRALESRGWRAEGEPEEVPDGPVRVVHDPSGNAIGLLQVVRPGVEENFRAESM